MSFKNISVKKNGNIINIRIFECLNSKEKIFEGEARVNNYDEMDTLMRTLEAKGYMSKKERPWWR